MKFLSYDKIQKKGGVITVNAGKKQIEVVDEKAYQLIPAGKFCPVTRTRVNPNFGQKVYGRFGDYVPDRNRVKRFSYLEDQFQTNLKGKIRRLNRMGGSERLPGTKTYSKIKKSEAGNYVAYGLGKTFDGKHVVFLFAPREEVFKFFGINESV